MSKLRIFIASADEWKQVAGAIKDVLENSHRDQFVVNNWPASFSPGRTPVLYHVLEAISDSDVGVFVLAPTDTTRVLGSDGDKTLTPRDNVLFELGLFIGAHGSDRAYLVGQGPRRRGTASGIS